MIVVSDTSVIVNLAAIGRLELMRALFSEVILPEAVRDEVLAGGEGSLGFVEIQRMPWLQTRADCDRKMVAEHQAELDGGEAEAILTQLATDTLPGITATKVTALGDLREAWITDNQTQGDAQSDATDERTDLTALVKTATDARITIQFAADAEYPYTTKANAAARKEFQLPANGPFTG